MQLSTSFEEPAAAGRKAQLILTLLIAALLPAFLLAYPVQTHAVKIDLPRLPDAVVPMPAASAPPAYALTTIVLPDARLESRPVHDLVVTAQDEVLWNGERVDMTGLRARLDDSEAGGQWVDFRPETEARYEVFAEVLATLKRARTERLRLDNRRFRSSIDSGVDPLPVKPRG